MTRSVTVTVLPEDVRVTARQVVALHRHPRLRVRNPPGDSLYGEPVDTEDRGMGLENPPSRRHVVGRPAGVRRNRPDARKKPPPGPSLRGVRGRPSAPGERPCRSLHLLPISRDSTNPSVVSLLRAEPVARSRFPPETTPRGDYAQPCGCEPSRVTHRPTGSPAPGRAGGVPACSA